ncbi:MAG TPA: thermonuclease family protein, partial [Stellaceae bacterium]|nr:thermonuclease family protein [Stellaceae bacterium]
AANPQPPSHPAPPAANPPPPPRPQQAAAPLTPATLSGPAQATGTVTLALQGHSVRLFGIASPGADDRCRLGSGEPRPCGEVAGQVLAERLAHSASITCAAPPGSSANASARICLDDKGVDIAGFLVGEGLALNDPKQTQDYRSAEGVARSLRKGLWAYR